VALDDLHGPNRVIRRTGSDCIYVAGPGHGGPALLGNVYLEGTYSETYPEVGQDLGGHTRFVRQFSTPGGVPSHVNVQTPGSIHVCAFLRAQGWDPILSQATTRPASSPCSPRPRPVLSRRSGRHNDSPAAAFPVPGAGPPSFSGRPKAGPVPTSLTASRSRNLPRPPGPARRDTHQSSPSADPGSLAALDGCFSRAEVDWCSHSAGS
jgi:hypothetical protein